MKGNKNIDISEMIDLYVNQSKSVEYLCSYYHLGKMTIKNLLKDNGVEIKKKGKQKLNISFVVDDFHIKKYENTKNAYYVAISKINGTEFKDCENRGGHLTTHINTELGIEIPSLYDRRMYYMTTGNYWWEQWFDVEERKYKEVKKCPFCDWETIDIENKSGAFEVHLKKQHNIGKIEYIKQFPEEKKYFELVDPTANLQLSDDETAFITCKVCGKKVTKLTKHLRMAHNMNKLQYMRKFGETKFLSDKLYTRQSVIMTELNKNMKYIKSSKDEIEIRNFIKSFGINCKNDRSILEGQEIDIFLPDKNIGIEYNGNKWHTEYFANKDKNYHLNKTNMCKDKGVKLIQIFEDEYNLHKDIVLNKLKHMLNISSNLPKVYGRKCIIKEIFKSEAETFLKTYHIQGFATASVYLGAYYNDKLIGVMTFLNENNGKWNLNRFASDYNYICCGIGGKLFNYFVNMYNPIEIKSFADRRWTIDEDNNVYIKMGFNFEGYTNPEYRYYNSSVDRYERFHKFRFRKEKLNKKFGLPLTMTETEMIKQLGYDRIWDCGLIRYVWKNKKKVICLKD